MNVDLNAPWPASAPRMTLMAEEMRAALNFNGVPSGAIWLFDEYYSLPAVEWVTGEFANGLDTLVNGLGFRYQADSGDCDDFARLAAWYAQYLQNRTRPGDSALALGEFAYIQEEGKAGHAVCVAVTRIEGELAVRFFEPQPEVVENGFSVFTMKPMELTLWERSNALFCRF
jgi:hypothetical protein